MCCCGYGGEFEDLMLNLDFIVGADEDFMESRSGFESVAF